MHAFAFADLTKGAITGLPSSSSYRSGSKVMVRRAASGRPPRSRPKRHDRLGMPTGVEGEDAETAAPFDQGQDVFWP
jgi:hypothetical protein